MRKCPICDKGELVKVEDVVFDTDGYVFVVKGERCSSCSEEIPYEEETKRVIAASRKLGVWPEPMKLYRHLSKSGNGLVFWKQNSDIARERARLKQDNQPINNN